MVKTRRVLQNEYSLEYFRSYEEFLWEQSLSTEERDRCLSELSPSSYHSWLKMDADAVGLLQKIEQRHGIPCEIRLAIDDVAPRGRNVGPGLSLAGWRMLEAWTRLSYGQPVAHEEIRDYHIEKRGEKDIKVFAPFA